VVQNFKASLRLPLGRVARSTYSDADSHRSMGSSVMRGAGGSAYSTPAAPNRSSSSGFAGLFR
jgi:hypothetical protein